MRKVFIVFALAWMAWGNVCHAQNKESQQSDTLFTKPQEFVLVDSLGKEVKLSDFRGKSVLLDFGASWCGSCQMILPVLKSVYAEVKQKDVVFISISLDEKWDAWVNALRRDPLEWICLWDKNGFKNSLLKKQFRYEQIPHLVLIDKKGVVKVNQLNVFDPASIKTAILELCK